MPRIVHEQSYSDFQLPGAVNCDASTIQSIEKEKPKNFKFKDELNQEEVQILEAFKTLQKEIDTYVLIDLPPTTTVEIREDTSEIQDEEPILPTPRRSMQIETINQILAELVKPPEEVSKTSSAIPTRKTSKSIRTPNEFTSRLTTKSFSLKTIRTARLSSVLKKSIQRGISIELGEKSYLKFSQYQ